MEVILDNVIERSTINLESLTDVLIALDRTLMILDPVDSLLLFPKLANCIREILDGF